MAPPSLVGGAGGPLVRSHGLVGGGGCLTKVVAPSKVRRCLKAGLNIGGVSWGRAGKKGQKARWQKPALPR